jgi:hypothetical protein
MIIIVSQLDNDNRILYDKIVSAEWGTQNSIKINLINDIKGTNKCSLMISFNIFLIVIAIHFF